MVKETVENVDDLSWEVEQPQVYDENDVHTAGVGGRPKKKKEELKQKKFALRMKEKEYEELKQYSEKFEISINDVVRLAIKNYIQGGYNPYLRK